MTCTYTDPSLPVCNSGHCTKFQETDTFHTYCLCTYPDGSTVPNCDPKNSNSPISSAQCINIDGRWADVSSDTCQDPSTGYGWANGWRWSNCFCCCTCLAASTPVAVPDGFTAIGDFLVGDPVLTASHANGGWIFAPDTVQFSSGTPATTAPGGGGMMVFVEYGESAALVATPDQLFVMADGKLKRADQLVPAVDTLVGGDGSAVDLARIQVGHFSGAVHHIATDVVDYEDFTGSLDHHIINAQGILVGDYLLQMFQDTPKMGPLMEQAPAVGTTEYHEANPDLAVASHAVGATPEALATAAVAPNFKAFGGVSAAIPDDAVALFSPQQEAALLDPDIPKRGFADPTNHEVLKYLTTLYGGFFPGVRVYVDWNSTRPNVFAFESFGEQTVVVGGLFPRLGPLYGASMSVGIAFGVAAAQHQGTINPVENALYSGIGYVMMTAYGAGWYAATSPARGELALLLDELAAKVPASDGGHPTAACLRTVVTAALDSDDLPNCTGTPPAAKVALESASYQHGVIVATFSEPLDPKSASLVANYTLTPSGRISRAMVDPKNPSTVRVWAALAKGSYQLGVSGLRAADGDLLDRDASTAQLSA